MFEIIGFILTTLFFGWLVAVGFMGNYVTLAFSGKLSLSSIAIGILGVIGLYFILTNSPFTISIATR